MWHELLPIELDLDERFVRISDALGCNNVNAVKGQWYGADGLQHEYAREHQEKAAAGQLQDDGDDDVHRLELPDNPADVARLCHVCWNGESEEDDAIVRCKACDVAVHQQCYGVTAVPADAFYCKPCEAATAGSLPSEPPACLLCLKPGGALARTTGTPGAGAGPDGWVHLFCSNWTPETFVADEAAMEPVTGLRDIPAERWRMACLVCKERGGGCIQCAHGRCAAGMHPSCALSGGLLMEIRERGELLERLAYCAKHSRRQTRRASTAEAGDGDAPSPAKPRHKKARTEAPPSHASQLRAAPKLPSPPPLPVPVASSSRAAVASAQPALPPVAASLASPAAAMSTHAARTRAAAAPSPLPEALDALPPQPEHAALLLRTTWPGAAAIEDAVPEAGPVPRKQGQSAKKPRVDSGAAVAADERTAFTDTILRYMYYERKAYDGGPTATLTELHNALRLSKSDIFTSSHEKTCTSVLSDLFTVTASRPKPLLSMAQKKPQSFKLTVEGVAVASRLPQADVSAGAGDAERNPGRADAAGPPQAEDQIYQANVTALETANTALTTAQKEATDVEAEIVAHLKQTAEGQELLDRRITSITRTADCTASVAKVNQRGTAQSLMQELLQHVTATDGIIPAAWTDAGSYRMFVLNVGACSGGGGGNATALLETAIDLVHASRAALAVLLEVPKECKDKMKACMISSLDRRNATWKLATSEPLEGDRGECVAFLWNSARFTSDEHVFAVPGWDAKYGRAPAMCNFMPKNDENKLDITVYGVHLASHVGDATKALDKLADYVAGLQPTDKQRVVLAGDFNLLLRRADCTPGCSIELCAEDCMKRLQNDCGLLRVEPKPDLCTTLDEVKTVPRGKKGHAIDHVWLHTTLAAGVTIQPRATVVCFDEALVKLAAGRQPKISRKWLCEGLRSFDGAEGGGSAAGGIRQLGWPDHRPLILDLLAKNRAAEHESGH